MIGSIFFVKKKLLVYQSIETVTLSDNNSHVAYIEANSDSQIRVHQN